MQRYALVACWLALLTAAGCGGDSGPAAPSNAPATAATATPTPAPVGGQIQEPRKTKHVQPVYPAEARQQRIQGMVIVEFTIDTAGRVREPRVIRSVHALLDDAAVEAIRQWEYEPTLLNGVPVPVLYTVTVNFSLQ